MKLFPYQKLGANFLASKTHALLSDEMGLGKSAQAIRAADTINARQILVVCPASAKINWEREFEKFSSRQTCVDRPILIIESFEKITKSIDSYCAQMWDLVIVDEAHFLKTPTSKRTQAVMGKLLHSTSRMWLLTGTPCPNHAAELWVMLYTFGKTKLSYEAFIERYCKSYQVARFGRTQIVGTTSNEDRLDELRTALSSFMLRRMKSEVLKDLPSITYGQIFVEPSNVNLSNEMKEKLKLELERAKEALGIYAPTEFGSQNMIGSLIALSQSVSSLRRYSGIRKVKAAAELIRDELLELQYDKVVVFAVHKAVVLETAHILSDFNPAIITGSHTQTQRQEAIDRFQKNDRCRVFIGNIKAAGTAITLTAAHNVVFIEQEWVPGDNDQAAMRCHRIGQKNNVFVRYVCMPNSLDEKISSALLRKAKEISAILG